MEISYPKDRSHKVSLGAFSNLKELARKEQFGRLHRAKDTIRIQGL